MGKTWVGEIQVPALEVRGAGDADGVPGTAVAGGSVDRGLGDIWSKPDAETHEFTTQSAAST